jgi:hypothetical protein
MASVRNGARSADGRHLCVASTMLASRREVFSPCINNTGILRPAKSAQVIGLSDPPPISVQALSRVLCRPSSLRRAQAPGSSRFHQSSKPPSMSPWSNRALVAFAIGERPGPSSPDAGFCSKGPNVPSNNFDERRSPERPHYHEPPANDQPDRPTNLNASMKAATSSACCLMENVSPFPSHRSIVMTETYPNESAPRSGDSTRRRQVL